jgi:hypothetical protein
MTRGTSQGRSHSKGESESLVPILEWLPSQTYSLPEQLHRLSGEIQNLALREVFVKVDNAAPVRTRTITSKPAFATSSFKHHFMPIFHRANVAKSPCIFPSADVDRLIARHLTNLSNEQRTEPDFARPETARSFDLIKGGKRSGDNQK